MKILQTMYNTLLKNLQQTGAAVRLMTDEQVESLIRSVIAETKAEIEAEFQKKQNETYLTREQVCQMLGVDASSLWRWSKKNYLVPVHIGCKVRYRLSDIEKLMEGGRK